MNGYDVIGEAPGRVNLLGEHTDYNDGFLLPIAIPQKTRVAMRRRDDGAFELHATALDRRVRFSFDDPPTEHFASYVYGCLFEARAIGMEVPALDIRVDTSSPAGGLHKPDPPDVRSSHPTLPSVEITSLASSSHSRSP